MSAAPTTANPVPGGHTRWGRVVLVLVPALAALVVVVLGVQQQVLAASFVPGGVPLTLTIDRASAERVAVFGTQDVTVDDDRLDTVTVGIGGGRIYDLCASLPVPLVAGFRLQASGPAVLGGDLAVGADSLRGEMLHFEGIVIGRDASVLQKSSLSGPTGMAAIEADVLTSDALRANAPTVTAGTFELTGLTFGVAKSDGGC